MGGSTEAWRVRIGLFAQRSCTPGVSHRDFQIGGSSMCLVLRLLVLSMLLVAGDVESNPGPNPFGKQNTERRQTHQTTLTGTFPGVESESFELADIMRELRNLNSDLCRKMGKMDIDLHVKIDELTYDIHDVQQELRETREETTRLADDNKHLEEEVRQLTSELDGLKG